MMKNLLIWVNEQDEIIGYGEKMETHQKGKLHRAFSVFIFDKENHRMLLQKRASGKYHSGGLWSNACCSHPYQYETWMQAIQRGVQTELNISLETIANELLFSASSVNKATLRFIDKFQYYSDYGMLSENEIDYVFLFLPDAGILNSITPNLEEISEIQWISILDLNHWLSENPDAFTSWFQKAYALVEDEIFKEYI